MATSVPYPQAKRNRNCNCCGGRLVREQRRVGKPGDPDYAVAVCPTCDLTGQPTITWPEAKPPGMPDSPV